MREVGLVAMEPMPLMSLAAISVLQTANAVLSAPAYRVRLLSQRGGAGIDTMLAFVEADLGEEVARSLAERMILERRRPGGGAQVSGLLGLRPKMDRIETVLTHAKTNLRAGIRHIRTRPYTPKTNGKLERVFQTLLREWTCAIPYRFSASQMRDLPRCLVRYRQHLPHAALHSLTPSAALNTLARRQT